MAAIERDDGAALRLSNLRRLPAAAAGSHFMVWGIEGWTTRNQILPVSIGDISRRNAPHAPGISTKSAAPIAGTQRRRPEIETEDDAPTSAGSEAASTVIKLN